MCLADGRAVRLSLRSRTSEAQVRRASRLPARRVRMGERPSRREPFAFNGRSEAMRPIRIVSDDPGSRWGGGLRHEDFVMQPRPEWQANKKVTAADGRGTETRRRSRQLSVVPAEGVPGSSTGCVGPLVCDGVEGGDAPNPSGSWFRVCWIMRHYETTSVGGG